MVRVPCLYGEANVPSTSKRIATFFRLLKTPTSRTAYHRRASWVARSLLRPSAVPLQTT